MQLQLLNTRDHYRTATFHVFRDHMILCTSCVALYAKHLLLYSICPQTLYSNVGGCICLGWYPSSVQAVYEADIETEIENEE